MKRILLAAFIAVLAVSSWGATTTPIQLLNPAGSTSGQAIVSTGPTTAPAWGGIAASAITGVVPLANGGTNAATAAAALTNLGADAVGSTTNKDVYVSTVGNDSNNGTSWGYSKLTLQAAVNAASAGGTVHVGSGTYSLTSTLLMQPKVRIDCVGSAKITQPNAQNLTLMFDFATNSANGASITNCTIDGNRSNNTDNVNAITVFVGSANDVTISGNTIQNSSGNGIDIGNGLRPIVAYNKMSNFYAGPIYVVTGAGQTATNGQFIGNNISGAIGQHAISLNNSDYNLVSGNTIIGSLQKGMTVNTSGTTVTLTAGPNFSTVVPGSFIILNGGVEFLITSVTDNTHLQVNTTPGTLSGVPAAIGPGDLLTILASSSTTIIGNTILNGVGGGVVISNFASGESAIRNNVIGNYFSGQGEGCIELESLNTFSTQVFDNQIQNNVIFNCGVGGTAVAANTQYGIALIDFNPNTLLNTFIDGNYVRDDQGTPTTQNWLGLTSVAAGQVFVGSNRSVNTVNAGIANGIVSVTLSAGWGTTATSSAITSYGNGFILTVSSSGTGQALGPTVTVNTRATTANNPPVMSCQATGGTGAVQLVYGQSPGVNATPSAVLFAYNGTPVAGQTYAFLCRG